MGFLTSRKLVVLTIILSILDSILTYIIVCHLGGMELNIFFTSLVLKVGFIFGSIITTLSYVGMFFLVRSIMIATKRKERTIQFVNLTCFILIPLIVVINNIYVIYMQTHLPFETFWHLKTAFCRIF
jgi:hypothetical protein